MIIVKFKDKTFAIRKFSIIFGYIYRDLKHGYWWGRKETFFEDCKGTLEEAKKEYWKIKDKGKKY